MPVKKTSAIEQREGRLLSEVLKEKFDKHGHEKRAQSIVAGELGISQSRLSQLIREYRLIPKTILVEENEIKRDGGEGHTSPGQMSFLRGEMT